MDQPLTALIEPGKESPDIKACEKRGAYQAVRKALGGMAPAEVTRIVKDSNLKGRGGAGFNTGLKWSFVPSVEESAHPRYLVVNADEMEPGTFKDRYLMEGNPHQLVEGAILAAYAVQADIAYIFLRWAYRLSRERLERAIAEAYRSGYLGSDILGSGFSLELHLHVSGGRYICGEETGMLNAIEGKRANPRSKPPYPQVSGLWGKPTVVNNVETICNLPHIVNNGAEWFKGLSLTEEGGTKLYGASGRVHRPGLWELPMGTTLWEILDEYARGMQEGHRFRGLLPGGASTEFLLEEHFNVKMDFDSVAAAGSRLGTGTMIVLDDLTCPVGVVLNLERFFARESCGWCSPCWGGLQWVVQILEAIEEGRGQPDDLEILRRHAAMLGPGHTYCALAPGAMEPLLSALDYFHDDFEQHIKEQKCPWGGGR